MKELINQLDERGWEYKITSKEEYFIEDVKIINNEKITKETKKKEIIKIELFGHIVEKESNGYSIYSSLIGMGSAGTFKDLKGIEEFLDKQFKRRR